MPVILDSTSSGSLLVGGASTSGNITRPHNVSNVARDRVFAYTWVFFTGEANTTSATFAATFGGVAMTQVGDVYWDTNKGTLRLFELKDAARGSQSVVASFSGMPTELITRNFIVITETYSGVDDSTTPVELTSGGTSLTSSVVVASVKPAHRVISGHAVGKLRGFATPGYNKTKRQGITMLGGGALLVGDTEGAASLTMTATHNLTTAGYGAIGVALTPSVVQISAKMAANAKMRAAVATFRKTEPHRDRLWVIPLLAEVDKSLVAGNFQYGADGIQMPIWPKDPQDTLDYTLDWSKHLADDDEIVGVQHVVVSGSLRMFSESHNEYETQCWLSGGVVGVSYPVIARITTRRGRQHDRTFRIAVGQQ